MLSYIKDNKNHWTVCISNKVCQFDPTHVKYDALVDAIKFDDESLFVKLFDTVALINRWGEGEFKVQDGVLKYKDVEVKRVISDRIMEQVKDGFDYKPMCMFVEKLFKNPSFRAGNELYRFLEHKYLPITPDGCFLAYKAVTKNFKDKYTQTFDNKVGSMLEMPRQTVDDDCSVSCSYGFHVGSIEYVKGFKGEGDVVVICKVDPADVVSVPKDHSEMKVRCCKYEVVGLYEGDLVSTVENKYEKRECSDCGMDRDKCYHAGPLGPDEFGPLDEELAEYDSELEEDEEFDECPYCGDGRCDGEYLEDKMKMKMKKINYETSTF